LNKRALLFSTLICVVETGLFLAVIIVLKPTAKFSDILINNLPNLFIVIVTTWYVVFTYYILKSTEIVRKQSTEPFLQIDWNQASEKAPVIFENFRKISQDFEKALGIAEEDVSSGSRFINLNLKNINKTRTGRLFLSVNISYEIGSIVKQRENLVFETQNIDIDSNADKPITVLDINSIPKSIEMLFQLDKIIYSSSDSTSEVREYTGNTLFKCNGLAEYSPSSAVPQIEIPGKD